MNRNKFVLSVLVLILICLLGSVSVEADRYVPPETDFETVYMLCVQAEDEILCQVYRQEIPFDYFIPESVPSFEHWIPLEGARDEMYDTLKDFCHENFD